MPAYSTRIVFPVKPAGSVLVPAPTSVVVTMLGGPTGPQGPAGPTGPTGPASMPAARYESYVIALA